MDDQELIHTLTTFTLFADMSPAELEAIAHMFDEQWFTADQRILRQGFSGSGFYLILEGEAAVNIEGEQRARLQRGDFFGEVSVLLDEPPTADVVALTPLRCLVLPRSELQTWLMDTPSVTAIIRGNSASPIDGGVSSSASSRQLPRCGRRQWSGWDAGLVLLIEAGRGPRRHLPR